MCKNTFLSISELANLIKCVRPFLNLVSKAKAAKLVRALVDLFLDMEAATGSEVYLTIKIFLPLHTIETKVSTIYKQIHTRFLAS